MEKNFFEIPYYHDYISPTQARHLLNQGNSHPLISGLQFSSGRAEVEGTLESTEGLQFLVSLYEQIKSHLGQVLAQRITDRAFIDERVRTCFEFNKSYDRDFLDKNYKTIIGLQDSKGRTVIGPLTKNYCSEGGAQVAPIPEYLKGPHVTLFGPPDSAKMAINAMNAYHRKLKGEPAIIEELLSTHSSVPKWGADDEDSKTPLHHDLIEAGINLTACFQQNLHFEEGEKKYTLAQDHLSLPIKRFPGLALPATFIFYHHNPIPLHLYDFALHLFKNWHNEKALCFYVPKLENEEEARYIHTMIATAEKMIKNIHPQYKLGSVRLMIVLENPRAILRAHEIMDALYPYFVGASLGWHDYLGSTARLFKEDGNYRIPVKADPDIVIKYIKASHLLLADVIGSRGGIKVGGMYGILPIKSEIQDPSFQVTLKGFFKDVVTQLKRNLTGFWVAHPDFIRIGLATVEAFKFHTQGNSAPLNRLVSDLLNEPYRSEILSFIAGKDIESLDKNDPNYVRSLLVADIKQSDFIANNHPDEIRYNVFQSLQYLTDWLSGNGCVALPAIVNNMSVRVMDDLATAERSRWEVWHEIYHGRFPIESFIKIVHEEMHFIRKDLSHSKKIVQVKWDERTAKWYPVALRLMLQLMTNRKPAEFATELLMPFTIDEIRHSIDPWSKAKQFNPGKYELDSEVEKLNYYFERCGCLRFAKTMAAHAILDNQKAKEIIENFTQEEVIEAAFFHGNIGESRKNLDSMASSEQAKVHQDETASKLLALGEIYLKKFGFKFLVSAKGKSGLELLGLLESRLNNSKELELTNARQALFEITSKRFQDDPLDDTHSRISKIIEAHHLVGGVSIAISTPKHGIASKLRSWNLSRSDFNLQTLSFGRSQDDKPVTEETYFEIASLSKTIASTFAYEYFANKKISLDTPVNRLLQKTKSKFRIQSSKNSIWADEVTVAQLMRHQALNLHYVKGFEISLSLPTAGDILLNPQSYGYEPIDVPSKPGTIFKYSGGGFLVLEHLIESLEEKPIRQIIADFSFKDLCVDPANVDRTRCAQGYFDNGRKVPGGHLAFPIFAAGMLSTSQGVHNHLLDLNAAIYNLHGSNGISHTTAMNILFGEDKGAKDFMGALAGSGVFVSEAGENRIILHQGANEGFRALYVHCISGPDCGKGFTILSNGDNNAVILIAEIAQELLKHLNFNGISIDNFQKSFDFSNIPQEQIVNLGYKDLIFKHFQPTMAVEIQDRGPLSPLAPFNLATQGRVLNVTNQRFARAENLLSPNEPVFDPDLFCPQGKVMDSWETARHNSQEHDSLIFEIPQKSKIQFVSFSTKYHDGNQAEFVRLQGKESIIDQWTEIIPKTKMHGHSILRVALEREMGSFQIFKVDLFPDGGLSRIGLFANLPDDEKPKFKSLKEVVCERYADPILKSHKPLTLTYTGEPQGIKDVTRVDWASQAFGARIVHATNEHYGPAAQVISPFPPLHMFDGLESARSRKTGHYEEVIIEFAKAIEIREVIFDFTFFVNNNPREIRILALGNNSWVSLEDNIFTKPFAGSFLKLTNTKAGLFKQIKVQTIPDGGINRIHVYSNA